MRIDLIINIKSLENPNKLYLSTILQRKCQNKLISQRTTNSFIWMKKQGKFMISVSIDAVPKRMITHHWATSKSLVSVICFLIERVLLIKIIQCVFFHVPDRIRPGSSESQLKITQGQADRMRQSDGVSHLSFRKWSVFEE